MLMQLWAAVYKGQHERSMTEAYSFCHVLTDKLPIINRAGNGREESMF